MYIRSNMEQHIKGVNLKVLRKIEIELVKDRNILKWRVNLIKDNLIFGWLKPVSKF
jgi:hypothetical protein